MSLAPDYATGGIHLSRRAQEAKQHASLESLEAELTRLLLSTMESAAVSGADPFTNSRFDPWCLERYLPEAQQLLQLATRAEAMRFQLDLPANEGPAALYLEACAQLADTSDEHRLGPRRLAENLCRRLRG